MVRTLAMLTAILTVSAVGCGGTAISVSDDAGTSSGSGGSGSGGGSGIGGSGGTVPEGGLLPDHDVPDTGPGPTPWEGGTPDVMDEYQDPGCPHEPEPIYQYDCEPYGDGSDCGPDEACYPFVSYPSGPCESEIYGAYCMPAGTGTQGDPCNGSTCAPHFVCVVTGAGTQCAELCKQDGPNTCSDGRVCDTLDVAGMGVCM